MDNYKYLLYIDILGFSELVNNNSSKIMALFQSINDLYAHKHDAFQTIIFSDTILIFDKVAPKDRHDHEYTVRYACEFAYDLMLRSVDLEIQFRAILTYGEFSYKQMSNINAYYGKSLIYAYNREREINAIGLFIDNNLQQYYTTFKTITFNKELDFVYLSPNLESIHIFEPNIPIPHTLIDSIICCSYFEAEVMMLGLLRRNITTQTEYRIREKYEHTYDLYKQRYRELVEFLEQNDFNYKTVLDPLYL